VKRLELVGRLLMRDMKLVGRPWIARRLECVDLLRSMCPVSRSGMVLGMRLATLLRWAGPGVEGVVGFEK
jgi:hypothetical protein